MRCLDQAIIYFTPVALTSAIYCSDIRLTVVRTVLVGRIKTKTLQAKLGAATPLIDAHQSMNALVVRLHICPIFCLF